jgi:CoA:oxalate CoA-transferase
MRILEDIRILDFTHVWFGPYCTMMLAELGAEVIKIEPPWGAIGRMGMIGMHHGTSSTFYSLNLNKKSVSVNLKDPNVITMVKALVKMSDVVVENFVPGTMARLGLGYETLSEVNPELIYASLSGFGQNGPYSHYGSYAVVAEALSGHTYSTGKQHDPDGPPIPMAGSLGDLGPAMYAAFTIMAAIRHKDRTGEGQHIDVSQFDSMVAFNCCESVSHHLLGISPTDMAAKFRDIPNILWGVFPVKDGWVQVAGMRGKGIDNLKAEMGLDDVTRTQLGDRIKDLTRTEVFKWLAELDIPCAPVYEAHDAMSDPHLEERGMWVEVEHPAAGKYTVPNFPVKLSKTPGAVVTAAPLLGQHTRSILGELLGRADEELDALEKAGVITQWKE